MKITKVNKQETECLPINYRFVCYKVLGTLITFIYIL